MAEGSTNKQEISLGNNFDAVVRHGGTTVELKADGDVVVKTNGSTTVFTNGDVTVRPAANCSTPVPAASTGRKPGDLMVDGTIYVGISPDTQRPMHTTPADAPLVYTFNEARKYAEKLDAHGRQDWRVPTKNELNVLYQNRNVVEGFDVTGSYPAGWYWSSSPTIDDAWTQRFHDGEQGVNYRLYTSSLRCVR